MKQSDFPFVIFVPDFGVIRIKRRDYVYEPDWDKVSQWDEKKSAEDAILRLRPDDTVRRLKLAQAVALDLGQAMKAQSVLDLQRKLLKTETSLTAREKNAIVGLVGVET